MTRLRSSSLAVEHGSVVLFSDFANDGPMWSGEGPREVRQSVTFDENFKSVPIVHVGISMWDTSGETNQRADLRSENATCEGFELVFRTWGDSKVARIRADWMAFGEAPDDDQWEVD